MTSLKKGRSRHSALHAGMPAVQKLHLLRPRHTNLCTSIRATQGESVMPDGTSRFSIGGQDGASLHGLFDVPRISRCCRRSALAKIREDAPFDKVCYIGTAA